MTLVVNDKYALRRLLGAGGMGRVYLAQDVRESRLLVALKTLAPEASADFDAGPLSREFLVLADLDHPHLVKVFDFDHVRHVVGEATPGEPDEPLPPGLPFFTREYVQGTPLLTATARLSTPAVLRLLLELTGALAYLHRQDLLHRDFKPDNILVTDHAGDARQSRVKILDFGLASFKSATPSAVGNPRYLAPELLHGEAADTRSELYALGLVFYEVFAGRPAFDGQTTAEVARAISSQPPPPLPASVDPRLRDLVFALLEKDPAQRPGALEVVRTLEQVAGAEERTSPAPWLPMGSPRLTGRERELEMLEASVRNLADPAGAEDPPLRALVLTGAPGMGKSRLVQALRHRAQLHDLRFMAAACQPNGDAFSGGRALLRPLLLERPDLVTPEREVLRLVLSDRPITRMEHRTSDLSPRQAMVRIFDAARQLLEAAAQEQRLVLVMEDLHWADPESLELFRHLVLHLPAGAALMVGTSWPPGQSDSPVEKLLNDLAQAPGRTYWYELEGLTQAAVRTLLHRTAGVSDVPDALVERLWSQTEGNPLFIEEILKLSRGAESLEELLKGEHLPKAVGDAFRMQILALPEEALTALKGLAVWGTPANSLEIAAVTQQDRADCLEGLEAAASAQLVRWQGTGYWFWHNVLMQIVDGLMTREEAAEFHLRAGRRREAAGELLDPERVGRLVTHFSRAGDAARALGYALTGARLAEERFLARRAVELYERARDLGLELLGRTVGGTAGLLDIRQRLATLYAWTGAYGSAEAEALALLEDPGVQWDPAARTRLRSLLGEISTRRGEFDEALTRFREALEGCVDAQAAAEVLDRMAEVRLRRGELDAAQSACDEALSRLGSADAPVLRASIAQHLGRCAQQKADYPSALEHFSEARALYARAGYQPGLAATLNAIAQIYHYQDQYGQAREAHLEALQLLEHLGDVEGVATTLERLALCTWGLLDVQSAITYGKRSLEAWRRLGSPQGEAKALVNLGLIYHSKGGYGEALQSFEEAIALQRTAGDQVGLILSFQNLGITFYEIGALDDARVAGETALELATRSTSRLRVARCHHILGVIASARGETERARQHLQSALEVFQEVGNKERLSDLRCSFAEVALQEKNLEQAHRDADEAVALANMLGRSPLLVQARLVAARVALAGADSDLRTVMSDLEQIDALAGDSNSPDVMWQLWEVKGRLSLRLGRPREACRLLTRSMEVIHACYQQLPDRFKAVYVGDPRRQAVRQALQRAVAVARGAAGPA